MWKFWFGRSIEYYDPKSDCYEAHSIRILFVIA